MTNRPGLDAAVFDLDGVVTRTARLHAAAWKSLFDEYLHSRESRSGEPFRPFTDADYLALVDGRPRYDGVRAFLASRGITLDEGAPDDPPGRETVAGLGDRKDWIFRQLVIERGVDVDDDAVRFIRALRSRGIPVGVASSSRNTELILEVARLAGLFDARVDGITSERLGLRGKPAPDIFLECLRRLGVSDPGRALVAEDAVAGVEAGRAAGFGLVLGVGRDENAIALRERGADWIIRDFREISPERIETYFANRIHARPNALARWTDLASRLRSRRLAIFLDYDGTLTPIVDRPDLAVLPEPMRDTLRLVAAAWPTTIVSGRSSADVIALVGLDTVHYAGSHGFDIVGPGGDALRLRLNPALAPAVAEAARVLRGSTAHVPGVIVEDKTYSVAVHYRLVAEDRIREVERIVDDVLAAHPELKKAFGKKVFELRPAMEWDKGRAVLWLLDALGLDRPDVVPLYIGDDVTDEDAFRLLEARGIGILVTEIPQPTAARYSLQDVHEVRELLHRLAAWRERSPS